MPINVSPHPPPSRGSVGNFPCLEWHTCPRGQDIESLKCACAIRIVRVRGVQYSAVPCPWIILSMAMPYQPSARRTVSAYSSTLFDRRYACSSLLCWSSSHGYFIKYVWKRKFLSPSAITTVSWHSLRLTCRLRWIPLPFITMQQYGLVPFRRDLNLNVARWVGQLNYN